MQNDVRLTDAHALREMFVKKCYQECVVCPEYDQESGECWLILSPPIIDAVSVVHGRWEDGAFENSKRCSVCKKYATKVHVASEPIFDYTYCPHCGAKMDGGAEDANSR